MAATENRQLVLLILGLSMVVVGVLGFRNGITANGLLFGAILTAVAVLTL